MKQKRLPWNHEKTVARFWARVTKCHNCECWLFRGSEYRGWGRLKVWGFPGCPKGVVQAHRYAYALEHGTLDPEDDIHHDHDICKHRNCVNHAHLSPVDHEKHGEISRGQQLSDIDPWSGDDYLGQIL